MENPRRHLISAAISGNAARAIGLAVGLVLTSVVVRHLGPEQFGIWALINSVAQYGSLPTIGIPEGISRHVAYDMGAGRPEQAYKTIMSGCIALSAVGLLVMVAIVALSSPLADFFRLLGDARVEFQQTLMLMGLAIAVNIASAALFAGFSGFEKFTTVNAVVSLSSVVKLVMTAAFLAVGGALMGVAGGIAIANFVTVAIFLAILLRHPAAAAPKLRDIYGYLRPLFGFTTGMSVLAIAGNVSSTAAVVVAGRLLGKGDVAIIAIASMVVSQMVSIVASTLGPTAPRLAHLSGADKNHQAERLVFRSTLIGGLLSAAMVALVVVCGQPLLQVWLGPAFGQAALPLSILSVPNAIFIAQLPLMHLLLARAQHYWFAFLVCIEAALNVGLSIWLGHRYGIIGIVLGTALPLLLLRGLLAAVIGCRVLRLDLGRYGIALLAPALACLTAIAAGMLIVWPLNLSPLTSLIVGTVLVSLVFVAAAVAFIKFFDWIGQDDSLSFLLSLMPKPLRSWVRA